MSVFANLTFKCLFLGSTATDNSHYRGLAHPDVVKQRTMARTGKLAASALDTAYNVISFGHFPFLLVTQRGQQIGFKSHGTGRDTLGATDTGIGFCALGFVVAHNEQAAGALGHGHIQIE